MRKESNLLFPKLPKVNVSEGRIANHRSRSILLELFVLMTKLPSIADAVVLLNADVFVCAVLLITVVLSAVAFDVVMFRDVSCQNSLQYPVQKPSSGMPK